MPGGPGKSGSMGPVGAPGPAGEQTMVHGLGTCFGKYILLEHRQYLFSYESSVAAFVLQW